MKAIRLSTAVGATLLGWPLACVAAEGERRGLSLSDTLYTVLPIVVIFGLMLVFYPLCLRGIKKHTGMQRYEEHMQRVEAQLKRLADALEKRDKDDDHAA